MNKLDEMADRQREVRLDCKALGRMFVDHFNRIWLDTDNSTKRHHATEMQNWFNQAKSHTFKHNKKKINEKQLFDWFFMPDAALAVDLFDNEEEADYYLEVVDLILDEDFSVLDALVEVGLISI